MKSKKSCLFSILSIMCLSLFSQVHDNPFAVKIDSQILTTYTNPVIPGFYSDPSVCRVGEDYYLVTSTFEYFPGVPIFHSKDLVNWKQIGHCIHRPEQLPNGLNIFAATIRYHAGTFYMITTNTGKEGNFYVTAKDPAGPWSYPIFIDIPGIDPDLFFDDDGKTYVTSSSFTVYEIDLKTGQILTEGRKVWWGAGGRWAEAPHIYKKDGFYYLMAAEGGTEEAHSVTIARSNTVWGPYIENPANPILTHANSAGQNINIQGVGHADIIQAHDKSWWMLFHGYRKSIGYPVHHILGRETCLAPVSWPKYGWPVVNGNGTAPERMTVPTLPLQPFEKYSFKEEFEGTDLGLEWNFFQIPDQQDLFYKLEKGTLSLKGTALELGTEKSPAFVGRRLQHLKFSAIAQMIFDPQTEREYAGMTLTNNGQHFDILVKKENEGRVILTEMTFGSITHQSKKIKLDPGPVQLKVSSEGKYFEFSYAQGGVFKEIAKVDIRYLSTETVGWFTGVYVGFYATGKGMDCKTEADFDYFEYQPN